MTKPGVMGQGIRKMWSNDDGIIDETGTQLEFCSTKWKTGGSVISSSVSLARSKLLEPKVQVTGAR